MKSRWRPTVRRCSGRDRCHRQIAKIPSDRQSLRNRIGRERVAPAKFLQAKKSRHAHQTSQSPLFPGDSTQVIAGVRQRHVPSELILPSAWWLRQTDQIRCDKPNETPNPAKPSERNQANQPEIGLRLAHEGIKSTFSDDEAGQSTAKDSGGFFRRYRIDVVATTPFKTRHVSDTGGDLEVPVIVCVVDRREGCRVDPEVVSA